MLAKASVHSVLASDVPQRHLLCKDTFSFLSVDVVIPACTDGALRVLLAEASSASKERSRPVPSRRPGVHLPHVLSFGSSCPLLVCCVFVLIFNSVCQVPAANPAGALSGRLRSPSALTVLPLLPK